MSGTKVVGSAGAAGVATLPLTGSSTVTIVLAAAGMMVAGLLMIRASRLRKNGV